MKLALFFVITFAVSWTLWYLASLIPPDAPLRTWAFLPGTFAPAVLALWLTNWMEGPVATRALLERVFIWRVKARWYLFAVLYIAGIKLAAAIVLRVATGTWPQFLEQIPWFLFVLATISSWPFQAGEEIGWRGFALPRLTERVGLGVASLLLGVVWATWHLPLFLIAGTDSTGLSFPIYLMTVTAISVAVGWLYARTGGSLLLVMLLHSAVNNTPHFVSPSPTSMWSVTASPVQWLTLLLLWIGAGWFLVKMRGMSRVC